MFLPLSYFVVTANIPYLLLSNPFTMAKKGGKEEKGRGKGSKGNGKGRREEQHERKGKIRGSEGKKKRKKLSAYLESTGWGDFLLLVDQGSFC